MRNCAKVIFLRPCSKEGLASSDAAQSDCENRTVVWLDKRLENDMPVLGLAGCHCKLVQVRRLASQSVSPDQMGVFVGSGPK